LLREYLNLMVEKIRSKRKIKTRFGGEKFDLETLKTLPNESVMQAYAMNYLEPLGQGTSRIAFVLTPKKVLKIARNAKGIAQNTAELEVQGDPATGGMAARIYDSDSQGRWLISDLVRPLRSPSEFTQLTGVDWQEFVQDLSSSVSGSARASGAQLRKDAAEFTKNVYKMAETGSNRLKLGDLIVVVHWGKTPDGNVVILDYGFTEDVEVKHYPKTRPAAAAAPEAGTKKTVVKPILDPAPDDVATGR